MLGDLLQVGRRLRVMGFEGPVPRVGGKLRFIIREYGGAAETVFAGTRPVSVSPEPDGPI
jgi:hypothetical protein